MDVDKMFKLPSLPGGAGLKRKMGDLPSADVLKRFKPEEPPVPSSSNTSQTVTVEDEEDQLAREPSPPQGEFEDDDDEGRFFGGGLNDEQNQILDIFDKAGDEAENTAMTAPALRRLLAKFERTVTKNAEQRGKYPNDPAKFIESESDLDSILKQFLPLTQNPALYYPELVKSGTVALLASLLSHENTDIAIDVVQVVQELTDEDVGAQDDTISDEEDDDDDSSATRLALAQFIDALLSNSIFELLVSNLNRLDETEETDRQGVFQILGTLENLLSFMPPLADQVGATTTVLQWLLERVVRTPFDSNAQYASEILSILLQSSPSNASKVAEQKGVDTLLMILSQYRNKNPADGEEEEFMEDSFSSLCSLLTQPGCKAMFLEAEGVELMVIMMKERLQSRNRSLKVLAYALRGNDGASNCERFVDVLGLKAFFSTFMGKGDKKKKNRHLVTTFEDDAHLLGILVSLFTNLPSDSAPRIRLVAKFVENDYEKVDRLLELRANARTKLSAADRRIAAARQLMAAEGEEIDDIQEDEWYLNRLEAGLSALQSADYVLAWICMEDDGIKAHTECLLTRNGESLGDVTSVLKDMSGRLDVDEEASVDDPDVQQKVVLEGLIRFLEGSG